MSVNLTDWLGTNLAVLWLLTAVMLLALEPLRRDLTMVMLAVGPLVAALVAVVVPGAWYVHLVVGLVVSVACAVVLRPALLRAAERRESSRPT